MQRVHAIRRAESHSTRQWNRFGWIVGHSENGRLSWAAVRLLVLQFAVHSFILGACDRRFTDYGNVLSCSRAPNWTRRYERPDDRARGADTRHEGLNIRGNTVHSE
jgi:hypothetical protein